MAVMVFRPSVMTWMGEASPRFSLLSKSDGMEMASMASPLSMASAISLELERVRTRRKAGEPSMSVSKSAAAELWLISRTT